MPAYQISRSIEIAATPQQVFQIIADYGTWTTWSPWLLADPQAKVTVSKNSSDVGASYAWESEICGVGELIHRKLHPFEQIDAQLTFLKPQRSVSEIQFRLQPTATGTMVTWTMEGSLPWFLFLIKPMIETFVGMDYERGLKMLKDLIEQGAIPSQVHIKGIQQTATLRMIGVRSNCPIDRVGSSMDQTFADARRKFEAHHLPMTGPMVSVYTKFRIKQKIFDYISGYQVPSDREIPRGSGLTGWEIPAGQALRVDHIGNYDHLGNGWSVANQLVRSWKRKQKSCGTYEIYRTTPPETAAADLLTEIYLPLK